MSELETNLAAVRERIASAATRAGRGAGEVTIIAVTKGHPAGVVEEALACGLRVFGENRVQEAFAKFAPRGERPGFELHLIGALQRNKARKAAEFFDALQSLDRAELARDLDRHAAEAGVGRLPVLIEVNISAEPQKSGVEPGGLPALAEAVLSCPHLAPRGLMGIAALGADESGLRRQFALLRDLRDDLSNRYPAAGWSELSMGMSDDFEAAIREGASMVRLGRVLFGSRPPARD